MHSTKTHSDLCLYVFNVTTGLVNCTVFDELEFYKCWFHGLNIKSWHILSWGGPTDEFRTSLNMIQKAFVFNALCLQGKFNFGLEKYVDYFFFDNLVCLFFVSWFLHCLPCCFNNILEMTWNLRYLESMLADGLKGEKYVTWVCP